MRATLEFDLPEEREEFECAQRGMLYRGQIDGFWEAIRRAYKYMDKESWTYEEILTEYNNAFNED